MTSRAQLIEAVLSAPEDRWEAIMRVAATPINPRVRTGTLKQAAACFSPPASPRTIQRWAKVGLLHPIRITCRTVRWNLDECEALAARGIGGEQ